MNAELGDKQQGGLFCYPIAFVIELFNLTVHKLSWGEVYYGLKKGYLDYQMVVDAFVKQNIEPYSEYRYVELQIGARDGMFEVLKLIKRYSVEDDLILIEHDENELTETGNFLYVPQRYRLFWDDLFEYRVLREIINSDVSITEKFYKLYLQHSDINYKETWRVYIDFYFNGSLVTDEQQLYLKLLDDVAALKTRLKIERE